MANDHLFLGKREERALSMIEIGIYSGIGNGKSASIAKTSYSTCPVILDNRITRTSDATSLVFLDI